MSRQIVVDTETTGLSPAEGHRIIEVGCIEMVGRQRTGNDFHQYINPDREVEQGALAVHGITDAFLLEKPLRMRVAGEGFLAMSNVIQEYFMTCHRDTSLLLDG